MSDGRTRAAVELSRKIHREGYIPEIELKQKLIKKKTSNLTGQSPSASCFIESYCRQPKRNGDVFQSKVSGVQVSEGMAESVRAVSKHGVKPFFCIAAANPEDFFVNEVFEQLPIEEGQKLLPQNDATASDETKGDQVREALPSSAPQTSLTTNQRRKKHASNETVVVIEAGVLRTGCSTLKATKAIEQRVVDILHQSNPQLNGEQVPKGGRTEKQEGTGGVGRWSVRIQMSSTGFNEGSYFTSQERVWITLRNPRSVETLMKSLGKKKKNKNKKDVGSLLMEKLKEGELFATKVAGLPAPEKALAADDVLLTADENPFMQRARKRLKKKREAATRNQQSTGFVELFKPRVVTLHDVRKPRVAQYHYDVQLTRIKPPAMHDAKNAGVPDAIDNIQESVRLLKKDGFLNYFAHERFHEFTRINAHPGLHLLRGEYRAAATAMVHTEKKAKLGTLANQQAMRQIDALETRPNSGSIATAQKMLREALAFCNDEEASVSESICEDTFRSGLGLPFCMQLVAEFSANIWNQLLTRRIKLYGSLNVVEGDIIVPFKNTSGVTPTGIAASSLVTAQNGKKTCNSMSFATQQQIDNGEVTIRDVVLPIPGLHVTLPQNETADVFVSIMESYGISQNPETLRWDQFGSHHNSANGLTPSNGEVEGKEVIQFASGSSRGNTLGLRYEGGYRHMVHVPAITRASLNQSKAITWKHDDPNRVVDENGEEVAPAYYVKPPPPNTVDTLTLDLGFELPPGVYPSMLIRELCKMEGNIAPTMPLDDLSKALSRLPSATSKHSSLEELEDRNMRNLLRRKRMKFVDGAAASLNYAMVQKTILKNRGPTKRSILADMSGPKSIT